MRKARKAALKRLYEIAEGQNGFFTTKQAKASGCAQNAHPYRVHAETGFVSTREFICWPAFREASALI
jgi:hypothetical protein